MKKSISILLIILSLGALLPGCGGASGSAGGSKPVAQNIVAKPLTVADLDALPVASADMTEDELRSLIVTFMRYQNSLAWTPSEKLSYYNHDTFVLMAPGIVYGGLPYITTCQGNLYNLFNYYDDRTGTVDTAAIAAMKQDWHKVIGNQCSGSTYWAWARVTNSTTFTYTSHMTILNGCIPVGPYKSDPTVTNMNRSRVDTRDVCKENGEQIMYQSYAAMKPADGVVYHYTYDDPENTAAGHVIMVSSVPNVVYNADGTINGKKSTMTFLDQALVTKLYPQENGINKRNFGSVDATYTFTELYEKGGLPWTLPEFAGLDPIEKGEVTVDYKSDSVTVDDLVRMDVKANYAISYNQIVVRNEKGEELYRE